jgi:hypothetical protein
MDIAPRTGALRRGRFVKLGSSGLLKDAARPGRKPSILTGVVVKVIEKTTQSRPANATHWSRSTTTREVGVSDSNVGRIWKAHGLKPHRLDSFKIRHEPDSPASWKESSDLSEFTRASAGSFCRREESDTGAGPHPAPPADEKGARPDMTHDYKRNGTTTLFAALDTATGEVLGPCQQRHRDQESLKFLRMIDETIAAEMQIHIICDNYATHKYLSIKRWIAKHARFHVDFTATSASWRNMIERFFRGLDRQAHSARHLPGRRATYPGNRWLHRQAQREHQAP